MNKTPEEIAEEYSKVNTSLVGGALGSYRQGLFEGFLAGYQAAKDYNEDTLLAAFKAGSQSGNNVMPGLSGYIPADFNDFLLSLPAKDQVANVSKVMPKWNSVDTVGDLINRSAIQHTLAALEKKPAQQWIRVKEQNPEARKMVLVRHKTFGVQIGFIDDNHARPCRNRWIVYVREFEEDAGNHIPKTGKYEHIEITHWMELPTAPKEEV